MFVHLWMASGGALWWVDGDAGSPAVKRVFLVRDLRGPDPKVSAELEGEIDRRDSATAFVSREDGNLSSSALRWILVHFAGKLYTELPESSCLLLKRTEKH